MSSRRSLKRQRLWLSRTDLNKGIEWAAFKAAHVYKVV